MNLVPHHPAKLEQQAQRAAGRQVRIDDPDQAGRSGPT